MKSANNLILIAFLFQIVVCSAQNVVLANSIKVNNTSILGTNFTTSASTLGETYDILNSFSETDNAPMKIYKYDGLKLYVIDEKIDSFEITKSTFTFSNHIKVGDHIIKLNEEFPLSYNVRKNDHLVILIEDYTDKYISIHFNEISNRITKIRLGTF